MHYQYKLLFIVIICVFGFAFSVCGARSVGGGDFVEVDVVIVGAGYAGLTAARSLEQTNREILVFEATNRSGGRTFNRIVGDTKCVIELGGEWIGNRTSQRYAWNLIVEQLGFAVSPGGYSGAGRAVLTSFEGTEYFDGGVQSAFHLLSPLVKGQLSLTARKLQEIADTVPLESPWLAPEAVALDGQTFATWVLEAGATHPEAFRIWEVFCTTLIAQQADVVSALHVAFYVKANGGLHNVVIGEQRYRIVGGSQAPAEKMAKQLGKRVIYNAPVYSVESLDDGSALVTAGDMRVRARRVIVTGPPPVTARINFSPALPFERVQLSQRMPLGTSVKMMAVYKHAWWRALNFSGILLATRMPGDAANSSLLDLPLLSNCFDNSPTPPCKTCYAPAVMLCFCEGDCALRLMRRSEKERVEYISKYLESVFGEYHEPDQLIDFNWAAQPFTGGAYASYMPPGVWTQFGSSLRTPYGLVHWAGTETALDGFGYINGAIASGIAAARAVDRALDAE